MAEQPVDPPRDEGTIAYFDERLHDYGTERLEPLVRELERRRPAVKSLIDIGCGTGNYLGLIRERTGIEDVAGIDVSPRCVALTHERLQCDTRVGSILDDSVVRGFDRQFDCALLGQVLHHLVGRTRATSRALAKLALRNTIRLVAPGGLVLILEPVFRPALAMSAVFYAKSLLASVAGDRIELFGLSDANLGAPVVSYFTREGLLELVEEIDGLSVAAVDCDRHRIHPLVDLLGKEYVSVVAERR